MNKSRWVALCLLALTPAVADPVARLGATGPTMSIFRAAGLHVVDLATNAVRWLGPGGHPGWSADGRLLYVEAHHGSIDAAPLGPIYLIDASSGQARALAERDPLGLVRPSPSGTYLAALEQPGAGTNGAVAILRGDDAKPFAASIHIGPLTPRGRQAYAWLPARDELLVTVGAATDFSPAGLYRISLPSLERTCLGTGDGMDGVWPSPDGHWVAVRIGGTVSAMELVEPGALGPPAVEVPWPEQPGVEVLGLAWTDDSSSVWLDLSGPDGHHAQLCGLSGERRRSLEILGDAASGLTFAGDAAYYLGLIEDGGGLWRLDLTNGEAHALVRLTSGLELRPHPDWPAPAPALSPDGTRLAVSLGRTDRWGVVDADVIESTDTNIAGKTVKVQRRLRNVGASGIVFGPADQPWLGQAAPAKDSPVATAVRAGGMRWERPCRPLWVVLHHTATNSAEGSLNALTSPASHRIVRRYDDISPAAWLLPEPRTLSVHYVALREGSVVQLVEERYIARHAGSGQWRNSGPVYDFNVETIGIEIVSKGNDYTAAQVRSVGRLVADICRRNGIPLERVAQRPFAPGVLYHTDFARGTSGKIDPSGWPWGEMMGAAKGYLAGGPQSNSNQ